MRGDDDGCKVTIVVFVLIGMIIAVTKLA